MEKIQTGKKNSFLLFKDILSRELLSQGNFHEIDERKILPVPSGIKYHGKFYPDDSFYHNITKGAEKRCISCKEKGKEKKTSYACDECGACPLCFIEFHRSRIPK